MTLVGEIKLESLIAGQHSTTRGNRSDHMNDKQAFPRLWHLCPSDCDKHSSMWQRIHKSGTSMFIVLWWSQSMPVFLNRMLWFPNEDHWDKWKSLTPVPLLNQSASAPDNLFTLFIYLFISTEDIFWTNAIPIPPNIAKLI